MKLINEMIDDLIKYSNAYNRGEMDKETLNLQLELLKNTVLSLSIDFTYHPLGDLDDSVKYTFKQLLQRHKHKAAIYLDLLIQATDKRRYNKIARVVVKKKLFFIPFSHTMKRSIEGYKSRNVLTHTTTDFQILIVKRDSDDKTQ